MFKVMVSRHLLFLSENQRLLGVRDSLKEMLLCDSLTTSKHSSLGGILCRFDDHSRGRSRQFVDNVLPVDELHLLYSREGLLQELADLVRTGRWNKEYLV